VLLLLLSGSGIFAQPVIYDTIVPQVRFSYNIGFRYSSDNLFSISYNTQSWNPVGPPIEGTAWADYVNTGLGLFYQAEWKHFMLRIAPSYQFMSLHVYRSTNVYGNLSNDKSTIAGDIQPLYRLSLANGNFQSDFFAGPELSLGWGLGMGVLAGFDLGFKITQHHCLVLGLAAGCPILDFVDGSFLTPYGFKDYIDKPYNNLSYGLPWKVQLSIGIRTLVIEDVYYYQGEEVGRRRN